MRVVLAIAASYLLGSVPFGLVMAKVLKGVDVRQYGSGNIGATNVLRAAGPFVAALVLLADAGKGVAGALLGKYLAGAANPAIAAGLAAVVGHSWPVFLRFRGGRGAATAAGVFVCLAPWPLLCAVGVWVLLVATTRYVSLGSITGALSMPVFVWAWGCPAQIVAAAAFTAAVIVWRHRANIQRLLAGKELKLGQKVK